MAAWRYAVWGCLPVQPSRVKYVLGRSAARSLGRFANFRLTFANFPLAFMNPRLTHRQRSAKRIEIQGSPLLPGAF
jgi:hypothetical protein